MINELRLLELMNANRNQSQGLVPPDGIPGQDYIPGIDANVQRQVQNIERQPTMDQPLEEDLGVAERELRAMLGQVPQRKPAGIGRSILGFLAGFGNTAEAGERAKYAEYYRDMDQFKEKLDPVRALAVVEGQRRNTERQIRADDLRAQTAADRLKSQEEIAAGKRQSEAEARKIQQYRADTERWKAEHRDHKYIEDVDGNIWSVNPATNVKEQMLDREGDPIKTIHLTPEQQKSMAIERITAQGAQTRQNIAAQGTVRQGLQDDAQAAAAALADKNIAGRKDLKKTPSGTPAATKTIIPTQQDKAKQLLYAKIISGRPELAKYYHIDPKTKMITVLPLDKVKKEGTFWNPIPPNEKERNEAYNLLHPENVPMGSGAGFNAPGVLRDPDAPKEVEKSAPEIGDVREDGKTFVKDKNTGRTGWTDNPDLPQYN